MESPLSESAIYGTRVAKGTITSMNCDPASNGFVLTERYVLGQGGEELTMLDGSGTWQRTNVYAGGRQLATYDIAANPAYTATNGQPATAPALHFQLVDALGTRRVQTNADGQPETDIQSLPYGDGLVTANDQNAPVTADDATPLHFTGKERDTESGNDYFEARYYSSSMGRFMSPDWSAQEEPVPYAKLDDPQSLNLYSYVLNNPLTSEDPDGHDGDGPVKMTPAEAQEATAMAYSEDTQGGLDEDEAIVSTAVNRVDSGDKSYSNGDDLNLTNVINAPNQYQGVSNDPTSNYQKGDERKSRYNNSR